MNSMLLNFTEKELNEIVRTERRACSQLQEQAVALNEEAQKRLMVLDIMQQQQKEIESLQTELEQTKGKLGKAQNEVAKLEAKLESAKASDGTKTEDSIKKVLTKLFNTLLKGSGRWSQTRKDSAYDFLKTLVYQEWMPQDLKNRIEQLNGIEQLGEERHLTIIQNMNAPLEGNIESMNVTMLEKGEAE